MPEITDFYAPKDSTETLTTTVADTLPTQGSPTPSEASVSSVTSDVTTTTSSVTTIVTTSISSPVTSIANVTAAKRPRSLGSPGHPSLHLSPDSKRTIYDGDGETYAF